MTKQEITFAVSKYLHSQDGLQPLAWHQAHGISERIAELIKETHMGLTPDELKNLTALVEVGAKAASHDKSLRESHAIQQTALVLLEKIAKAHEPQSEPVSE